MVGDGGGEGLGGRRGGSESSESFYLFNGRRSVFDSFVQDWGAVRRNRDGNHDLCRIIERDPQWGRVRSDSVHLESKNYDPVILDAHLYL